MKHSYFLAIAGLASLCLGATEAHAGGDFPLEGVTIDAVITGPIAELTVYQRFTNTHDEFMEATYMFPLHQDAAVDGAAMRIGGREIRAQLHTRERAREIYEEARDSGQASSLTEQERPNIFTQSVANIPPGEDIEVVLHLVQPLTYEDGRYRLDVPLVVGPRFVPAGVEDAARVTAPIAASPAAAGPRVSVSVEVEMGMALSEVWSSTHPEASVVADETGASVELLGATMTRDFVLNIDPANTEPVAAALAQDGHFALLFEPQPAPAPAEVVPRELIFVVDHSCSMSGEPLDTVKEVMDAALEGMLPGDSFQIIRFSEAASALGAVPLPATPENIARGRAYVQEMEGMGGTDMMSGVSAALGYPADPRRQRIVCFMTDGYIGNDRDILAAVEDQLGSARLFSFGIGSSVNRYLLDRMGAIGRGGVTYVLPDDDRASQMAAFYQRIARPVLTDIRIDWGGAEVEDLSPARLPDLVAGQSMLLTGRYTGELDEIVVQGRQGSRRYQESVRVYPVEGRGIASTWARAQVRSLEEEQLWGEDEAIVAEITRLALEYQLLTRYTSFVAVEREVRNPEGAPPLTLDQPLPLPDGVSLQDGTISGLSRDAMRPGDPLITADAPADAQGVIGALPWGELVHLRWDPVRQRWYHRFLVPRDVEEGEATLTLYVLHADGHVETLTQTLRIDASAPEFEAEAWWEGGETVIRLHVEEPLRAIHAFPEGQPDARVRLDLRQHTGDEILIRLPGQHASVTLAVKDSALNLHTQTIEAR